MRQYIVSHRWQLLGPTLFVLLAAILLLFAQTAVPALDGLVIRLGAPEWNAAADATVTDTASGIHPADRKFFGNAYVNTRDPDILTMSGVHAADRKFFDNAYMSATASDNVSLSDVHPADRKFYTQSYGPGNTR